MTEGEYQKYTRVHARALRELLLDFEFFVADAGNLNLFSVAGRVKSFESALEKERRLRIPIKDLQDLAGIRLVLSTSDDVDVIVNFIRDEERLDRLKILSDKEIIKRDGYRARHLVLSVRHAITHSVYDATVEIQLQTIMQHAYNFVSRAWVYKTDRTYTQDWQARFQRVAATLADLDQDIAELHAGVLESAARGSDQEPLTPFSFQRIVKDVFSEDVPLEDAVWHARFLIDLHVTTNGDLRAFFRSPEILALHQRAFSLKDKEGAAVIFPLFEGPMWQFFTFCGVRLEATHELIDALESKIIPEIGA